MTNEKLVFICQILIVVGGAISLSSAFGVWYFEKQIEKAKETKQKIEEDFSKAKTAQVGKLIAKKRKVLLSQQTEQYPALEIGNSGSILVQTGKPGTPLFSFKGGNLLIVRENEYVKVSVKLFNSKGDLLAELIDNEWKVNQSQTWDRNYSANALEVKNSSGKIILQIKVLQDRIQIQTILWGGDGYGLAL